MADEEQERRQAVGVGRLRIRPAVEQRCDDSGYAPVRTEDGMKGRVAPAVGPVGIRSGVQQGRDPAGPVVAAGGEVEGGLAVAVGPVRLRVVSEEDPDGGNGIVLRQPGGRSVGREMERGVAVLALGIGVAARLQEHVQGLRRADGGRGVDGGPPSGVGNVRIDAPRQQLLHLARITRRPAREIPQAALVTGPLCMCGAQGRTTRAAPSRRMRAVADELDRTEHLPKRAAFSNGTGSIEQGNRPNKGNISFGAS